MTKRNESCSWYRPRNENLNLRPNQILEFIFYIVVKIKIVKFTGQNKGLLVLDWRTGTHREDWW